MMLQTGNIGKPQIQLLGIVLLGKFQHFLRTTHPSSWGVDNRAEPPVVETGTPEITPRHVWSVELHILPRMKKGVGWVGCMGCGDTDTEPPGPSPHI
jgi:hypothetical protein